MADYANAVVKFKVNKTYKSALSKVLNRKVRGASKKLDWFDYFELITYDGKVTPAYDEDEEYLSFGGLSLGYYINLYEDFSLADEQSVSGNVVTLYCNRKWANIDEMARLICCAFDSIADEILSCEIIAYNNDSECYHRNLYKGTTERDDGFVMHNLVLESSEALFENDD